MITDIFVGSQILGIHDVERSWTWEGHSLFICMVYLFIYIVYLAYKIITKKVLV